MFMALAFTAKSVDNDTAMCLQYNNHDIRWILFA